MKLRYAIAACVPALTLSYALFSGSPTDWKIDGVYLAADSDPTHRLPADTVPNRLTVTVSNAALSVHFDLSSDVRLTAVKESFITGSKLVVLGAAGRASSVVIFDLLQRKEIDWFFCIEPKRISESWIVYVEWYPRLGNEEAPREVLLLYDLRNRSPAENRLPSAVKLPIPAPLASAPVEVGVPVYPELNVRQRSYANVVESSVNQTIFSDLSFSLLPRERLVFAAAEGHDFPSSRDYLVILDLSRGVDRPIIHTVEIPKDQFKKPGENPHFVKITGIEQASENAVRLFVSQSEYGVSSITVAVPGS